MVEGRLFQEAGERAAVSARLSDEFAEGVARALLDAKHSREAAQAAAANVPRWRFVLRRQVARSVERHQAQEQRLLAMLGGKVAGPEADA